MINRSGQPLSKTSDRFQEFNYRYEYELYIKIEEFYPMIGKSHGNIIELNQCLFSLLKQKVL